MNKYDLVRKIEEFAPLETQEKWDCSGWGVEACSPRPAGEGRGEGAKPLIVGFCAESENLLENAKTKIKNKGCDYIVANDISRKDIGFNSDENEVYIVDKNLNINHIEKDTKENIAFKILENIFE